MASSEKEQPSQFSKKSDLETDLTATAADLKTKMQGINNNHSSHNGVVNHVNDASLKTANGGSSELSSSKHNPTSSSTHQNKDHPKDLHNSGKSHSSGSKHKDGTTSSSKHKESISGSSSGRTKEKNSSSSKNKEGSLSSSHRQSSGSADKHKEYGSKVEGMSEKHKDITSSLSFKPKDNSSSSKQKEGSNHHSKDKSSSEHKHSSSASSDKHKSTSSVIYDKSHDKLKEHISISSKDHSMNKHSKDTSLTSLKPKESSSYNSITKKESSTKDDRKSDGNRDQNLSATVKDKKKAGSKESKKMSSNNKDEKKAYEIILTVKVDPESPSRLSNNRLLNNQPVSSKYEQKDQVKDEPASDDDDKPLSVRMKESHPAKPMKRMKEESDEDDEPLSARAYKVKKQKLKEKDHTKRKCEDDKHAVLIKKAKKEEDQKPKTKKEKTDEQQVWKWWEEEKREDGVKWTFLEHKGPVFAPAYEPLPNDIKFYYNGKPTRLSLEAEEVATFYAKMLDHDYTTREIFNQNFFRDWRKVMTKEEKETITDLKKCNFTEMNEYFKVKSEQRKNMTKEEKQALKKQNELITKNYGFCIIDGHKEKIGNFKIEPPGLFRGRGDHPKQGMLKRRVLPEDVIINCSKDSRIPQPPPGHKWKEVRHDVHVTWLASWNENIQGQTKYVMLNAASKLKGEKDWQKYEVARRLHKSVDKIRAQYREDWKSKEMRIRQRAVALYFIDKLALRAGNEKEEGETADTVGCCSLRVEHLILHEEQDGKQYVVEFDFLGKDSIRYQNSVPVEKRVFKNLQLFMENKQAEDDLFDRLNTSILNKYLHELMEGLTAKVFRTYNASHTLQEQLNLLTNPDDPEPAKILSYNRANRAVAVLCNHQRSVPKTFAKSMENLQNKIIAKKKEIKEVKKDIKAVKADYKATKTAKARTMYEKKKKTLTRLEEQLTRLEVQATDKDENKEIALSTSKLNYLDPRISVAWCKKFNVPLEKIYNKTQRDKFRWAIDMATAEFQF